VSLPVRSYSGGRKRWEAGKAGGDLASGPCRDVQARGVISGSSWALRRPQEAKVATQRGFPVAQTGGGKRRWLQLGVWRRAAARRRRRAEPRGVARRIGARRPALERCCLQIRLGTFNQKTENRTEVSVFRFLGSV
jgi:hypothetical protein